MNNSRHANCSTDATSRPRSRQTWRCSISSRASTTRIPATRHLVISRRSNTSAIHRDDANQTTRSSTALRTAWPAKSAGVRGAAVSTKESITLFGSLSDASGGRMIMLPIAKHCSLALGSGPGMGHFQRLRPCGNGLQAHCGRAVKQFIAAPHGRHAIEQCPSTFRSSTLSNTSGVTGSITNCPTAVPRDFGELSYRARCALRPMRRRPPLVHSFWGQAQLSL